MSGAQRLRAHQPAVHIQRLPGHEGRVVAGEIRQRTDEIGRRLHVRDRLPRGSAREPRSLPTGYDHCHGQGQPDDSDSGENGECNRYFSQERRAGLVRLAAG